MKDLDKVVTLLNTTSGSTGNFTTLVADATATSSWISSCDTTIVSNLFDKSISTTELTQSDIKDIIDYVLFTADSRTGITLAYRQSLIGSIIDYIEAENESSYYDILNSLLYDKLLARIISGYNSDYAAIQTTIENIINEKEASNLSQLVETYLEILNNTPEVLNPMFDDYTTEYLQAKINVLNNILSGFTDSELVKILSMLDDSTDTSSTEYYSYLLSHESEAREIYANVIALSENSSVSSFVNDLNSAFKQYNVSMMIDNLSVNSSNPNYSSSLANKFNSSVSSTIKNANYTYKNGTADYTDTNYNVTSLNRTPTKDYVSVWNSIKNNELFLNYLETSLGNVVSPDNAQGKGIYAVATEYTNTYQTLDSPSGDDNGLTFTNVGILRATAPGETVHNRFIYTPDDVVSYGTHYYGPYTTASNTLFTTATQNRYLDMDDTGTASAISGKYIPVYISLDRGDLYNKISDTIRPDIYEFVWNDYKGSGGGDSHSQWVSTLILDKKPGDSTDILYKNFATGNTYTYGGETVTTDYILYGYDFNPDLTINYNNDRALSQTIPGGNYSYTNLVTNEVVNTSYANTNTNLITNKAQGQDTSHKYRNNYLISYVSASLITGIYYNHSIWYDNGIQGVFLTAKTTANGVLTSAYTNYFIDDLLKLDGKRTKGMSGNVTSWDECNIINALMEEVMSTES